MCPIQLHERRLSGAYFINLWFVCFQIDISFNTKKSAKTAKKNQYKSGCVGKYLFHKKI